MRRDAWDNTRPPNQRSVRVMDGLAVYQRNESFSKGVPPMSFRTRFASSPPVSVKPNCQCSDAKSLIDAINKGFPGRFSNTLRRILIRMLIAASLLLTDPEQVLAQSVFNITGTNSSGVVTGGSPVTVSIIGAPGYPADWVGIYAAGAADDEFVDWFYLNGLKVPPAEGTFDATFTWVTPAAPGSYELRCFSDDSFNRVGASTTVITAQPTLRVNGVSVPEPVDATAGTTVRVDFDGGPGNARDWIAMYVVGANDQSFIAWKYVGGGNVPAPVGQSSASLVFTLPLTDGAQYEFRAFNDNGYSRLTTSTIVTASLPHLKIQGVPPGTTLTAPAGSLVNVEVNGGPGNSEDWIGLYSIGSVDSGFIQWKYLNGTQTKPIDGLTAATIEFALPQSSGTYEFRLFFGNSYVRLATSTTVAIKPELTVNGKPPDMSVFAFHTEVVRSGAIVSVGVKGGPAVPGDWVGLFGAFAPDTAPTLIAWKYMSGNSTDLTPASTATLTFTMPVSHLPTDPPDYWILWTGPIASYEFRLFTGNGWQRIATSGRVGIMKNAAVLSASPSTTISGKPIQVHFNEAPANATDWVGLFDHATESRSDWLWTDGTRGTTPLVGAVEGTVTFAAPATSGSYKTRLYADPTTLVAVSDPVVVTNTSRITVNGYLAPTLIPPVEPTEPLVISISGGPANRQDWVSLAKVGTPETESTDWVYLNTGTRNVPVTGVTPSDSGSVTFLFPNPVIAGERYEARFFARIESEDFGLRLAKSAPIEAKCDTSVTTSVTHFLPAGGTGTLTISVRSICGWIATSSAPWLTISSASSGSGPGSLTFSVATNASTSPRSATLTVAGRHITINQESSCTYTVSSSGATLEAAGGTGSVTVTTAPTCRWTAASDSGWVTVQSASGLGTATVPFVVAPNAGANRNATITIGGRSVAVTQNGPSHCTYSLSAPRATFAVEGGFDLVQVNAPAGCPWTASSNASWVTPQTPSGVGTTFLSYSVAANTGAIRDATLTIAGIAFPITQAALANCTFSLSSSGATHGGSASTGSVDLTGPSSCSWTTSASASWITVTSSPSGNGAATVTYAVSINESDNARSGALTIGGVPYTISQGPGEIVPTPLFSIPGGSYNYSFPIVVTVLNSLPDATIRYTLDRSEPTEFSSEYHSGLLIAEGVTLNARAFKQGYLPSAIATATYWSTNSFIDDTSPVTGHLPDNVARGFNQTGGLLSFQMSNGQLTTDPAATLVMVNGTRLPSSQVLVSPSNIQLWNVLQDGKNDIEIFSQDLNGYAVDTGASVWAGSRTLELWAFDYWRYQGIPGTEVIATLVDDPVIVSVGTTDSSGRVVVSNLPANASVRVQLRRDGYQSQTAVIPGGWTQTTIPLDVANNDLSRWQEGWDAPPQTTALYVHSETSVPPSPCNDCVPRLVPQGGQELGGAMDDQIASGAPDPNSISSVDLDFLIHNKNIPDSGALVRQFNIAPGTTEVTVRYRIQTSERPSWTQHPQDDWFLIRLESAGGGSPAIDFQSVYSLWSQFDGNGATTWRTLTLPTPVPSDLVRLTVRTGNTGDLAGPSWIYVDQITQRTYQFTNVQLFEVRDPQDKLQQHRPPDPGLKFLSVGNTPHSSFGGNTRVYGNMTVRGEIDDALRSVQLEVWDVNKTTLLAVGDLSNDAKLALLRPFVNGSVSTGSNRMLLFELPYSSMGNINIAPDGQGDLLFLRVSGVTQRGYQVQVADVGPVSKLVLFSGPRTPSTNRDLNNCHLSSTAQQLRNRPDFLCGGDGWTLPTVKAHIDTVASAYWDDFSKMNGGFFPPHSIGRTGSHDRGTGVDGWYLGYNNRGQSAANTMLSLLQNYGHRVVTVWVTYNATPGDPFYDTIVNVNIPGLLGGPVRSALSVIRPALGHTNHFHWVIAR